LVDREAVLADEAGGIGAGLEGELEHPEYVRAQDLAEWQLRAGVGVEAAASGPDHKLRDALGVRDSLGRDGRKALVVVGVTR
jgi:hypothetical protein